MYHDLRISNFRGLRSFTMEGLGRINLLVGPNNCGKTTVLEAINLLADHPDVVALGLRCIDRGAVNPAGDARSSARLALRHLFYGHHTKVGSEFVITGATHDEEHLLAAQRLSVTITPPSAPHAEQPQPAIAGLLALELNRQGTAQTVRQSIPITASAEWLVSDFYARYEAVQDRFHIPFIPAHSRAREKVFQELAQIALNPEEHLTLDILRLIEPGIEGITAIGTPELSSYGNRGGIFVKLKGQRERIPIGSLGEGIWRLLGLALGLVQARGRLLLVDEIDIGLHYSAQASMWKMVRRAAEELNVQVFATTHSRDCIEALAQLARPEVTDKSGITIQRLEGERSAAFNEQEMSIAAERGTEVR